MSLPNRHLEEEPLPFMRFNCEPLRYRHKSLLFYTVTHGANFMLQKQLKKKGYVYVPAQNSEKDLSYWYRLPSKGKVNEEQLNEVNPLVFIHGVGGLGFCNTLIEEIGVATQDDNVPIVLIDLPHVSLRFYDEIPLIKSQTKAISKILDDVTSNAGGDVSSSKATLVGHSFGTAVMSWLVQDAPEKISGCVFLGKICLLPFINCIVPLFLISSIPSSTRSNLFPASPQDHPFQFSSPKGGRGVAKQQKMG
jgi:pimeloyl-ACP methyl ester carboxylesterase